MNMKTEFLRHQWGRFAVFASALFLVVNSSHAGFDPAAFDFFATFTVEDYEGGALENFPVLVRLAADSPVGFSYADCAEDGSDVRFTDAVGNLIPHEIDTWDPDGESLIWVGLPVMNAGTMFTMYYGSKSSAGAIAEGSVWARYAAVIHGGSSIKNAIAGGPGASTPSAADKVFASAEAGKIGGGIRKNTANVVGVNVAMGPATASTTLEDTGKFSVSGWFKRNGNGGNNNGTHVLAASRKGWNDGAGFLWLQEQSKYISVAAANSHQFNSPAHQNTYILPDGEWAYAAFTYEKDVSLTSYFDGAVDNQKKSPGNLVCSGTIWTFGSYANQGSNDSLIGDMDELRIFDGVASGDWIKAEHDTVASTTFLTADAVVHVGASAMPIVGLVASSVEYTNATFSATVGSLGMDAGMTTAATWADLLLVVGTEETLSSPVFTVPLSRATERGYSLLRAASRDKQPRCRE